jgi:hypothetical protein
MDVFNTTTMQNSSNDVAEAILADTGIDWSDIAKASAYFVVPLAASIALGYALNRVEQRQRQKRCMLDSTYRVTATTSLPEDEAIKLQELASKHDRDGLKKATLEALGKTQDPGTKLRLREVLASCV